MTERRCDDLGKLAFCIADAGAALDKDEITPFEDILALK
jgi:hypothetical protein